MHQKTLASVALKATDKGEFSAVFSTFGVVDLDGDVTEPGAFEDGADVLVSAYGHASWGGALPIGKATIRTTDTEAIAEGQFFLDTEGGKQTYTVLKELQKAGIPTEWSYGYDVLDSDMGERDGVPVRLLKRLKAYEVSPVLKGAGIDTRTLAIKADKGSAVSWRSAIRPHKAPTTNRAWDSRAVAEAIADDASVSDLRALYAYCGGDPEQKSSYRFLHHHGVDGPASVRAVVVGIAELNSKSCTLADVDRRAVYAHLAEHLSAAGREPPELRAADAPLTFVDEIAETLVKVRQLVDTAERVAALRSEKGKQLSRITSEHLDWFEDEIAALDRQMKSLRANPNEIADQEFVRFLAAKHKESAA